ncbi:hypothetical protein BS78_05G166200 [Paspalum vaginatum]|nr:hypothetical protein BS78_05G166200 [Paspalum vaginatum]
MSRLSKDGDRGLVLAGESHPGHISIQPRIAVGEGASGRRSSSAVRGVRLWKRKHIRWQDLRSFYLIYSTSELCHQLEISKIQSFFLKNLTEEQKQLVKSFYLGPLLDFDCSEAPRFVSYMLARNFDAKMRTINLENESSFSINAFTVH